MQTDNLKTENTQGRPVLGDKEAVLIFLQSANSGILMYSMALTETTNPSARKILTNHLRDGLSLHRELADFMKSKGWLPSVQTASPRMEPPKIHFT